jgi:hypothetical protein
MSNIPSQYTGQTVSAFFRTIRIIHLAVLAGVITMACVFYFMLRSESSSISIIPEMLRIAGPVIGFGTLTAAYISFRVIIQQTLSKVALSEKLSMYMRAHIIKLALIEGGAVANLVLFFMTGNILLLSFVGLAALVIALNYPGIYRIGNDLRLDDEDMRKLDNPEHIL